MAGGTMSLDTTLADITARLRHNAFPNERAISQGIILRVLRELGWDTYATNVVWPEYRTGGGRAEFALCHPPSKPAIFLRSIEPRVSCRRQCNMPSIAACPSSCSPTAGSGASIFPLNRAAMKNGVSTSSTCTSGHRAKPPRLCATILRERTWRPAGP